MNGHPDARVDQAITQLADALCTWERATGRSSLLIIRERGFVFRAIDGKPLDEMKTDITDDELTRAVLEAER